MRLKKKILQDWQFHLGEILEPMKTVRKAATIGGLTAPLRNEQGPVVLTVVGKVVKAEYHDSWGNYVVVEHEDGVTTLYAHQQQYVVQAGQAVEQGQILGYLGSTGNSTGPHLHLELCRNQSLSQAQLMDPEVVLILE